MIHGKHSTKHSSQLTNPANFFSSSIYSGPLYMGYLKSSFHLLSLIHSPTFHQITTLLTKAYCTRHVCPNDGGRYLLPAPPLVWASLPLYHTEYTMPALPRNLSICHSSHPSNNATGTVSCQDALLVLC